MMDVAPVFQVKCTFKGQLSPSAEHQVRHCSSHNICLWDDIYTDVWNCNLLAPSSNWRANRRQNGGWLEWCRKPVDKSFAMIYVHTACAIFSWRMWILEYWTWEWRGWILISVFEESLICSWVLYQNVASIKSPHGCLCVRNAWWNVNLSWWLWYKLDISTRMGTHDCKTRTPNKIELRTLWTSLRLSRCTQPQTWDCMGWAVASLCVCSGSWSGHSWHSYMPVSSHSSAWPALPSEPWSSDSDFNDWRGAVRTVSRHYFRESLRTYFKTECTLGSGLCRPSAVGYFVPSRRSSFSCGLFLLMP